MTGSRSRSLSTIPVMERNVVEFLFVLSLGLFVLESVLNPLGAFAFVLGTATWLYIWGSLYLLGLATVLIGMLWPRDEFIAWSLMQIGYGAVIPAALVRGVVLEFFSKPYEVPPSLHYAVAIAVLIRIVQIETRLKGLRRLAGKTK